MGGDIAASGPSGAYFVKVAESWYGSEECSGLSLGLRVPSSCGTGCGCTTSRMILAAAQSAAPPSKNSRRGEGDVESGEVARAAVVVCIEVCCFT